VHKHNAKSLIRSLSRSRDEGPVYSAIGFGGLYRTVNPMSRMFVILGVIESPYYDQIS
jgi:hypothetical protein